MMGGMASPSAGSSPDQLRALLPTPPPKPANQAQVLIASPLELTLEQETNMCLEMVSDFHRLSTLMGRKNYAAQGWATQLKADMLAQGTGAVPFFAQRHLAHQLRMGRVEWRAEVVGGLFAESNVHIPLIERYTGQQIARACDSFFGTSPWFTATPVTADQQTEADKITAWARHEADEAGLEAVGRDAVALAFTQGEQVIALFEDEQLDFYTTSKVIAIGEDGNPITANDGDYIYPTDTFVPLPVPVDPTMPPGTPPAVAPTMVLKRDSQGPNPTPQPPVGPTGQLDFQLTKVVRKNVRFAGPKAGLVYYQDFLCDLTEKDIQSASVVIEVTTVPLMSLIHKLLTSDAWKQQMPDPQQQRETIARLIDQFGNGGGAAGSSSVDDAHSAAVLQPRAELGESKTFSGTTRGSQPNITLLKVWKHVDARNSGYNDSVVALITPDGKPLYYDYVANMTHDGLRPYEVLRVNPVPGRWHGTGEPQMFFQLQQAADLLFNRYLWAMSQAGNVVFWNPDLTREGAANQNLEFNNGTTYTLNAQADPEKALRVVPVHNIKGDEILKGLEIIFQAATNRSGVSNPNDSRMAGLDTAQLATGVNNIERAGQELFGKFLSDLTPPMRSLVKRFLGLVLFHVDADKVFIYFEGDMPQFVTLTPEQLRNLTLHVTIDLSRYNGQQKLLQAQAVAQVMDRFANYAQNPPLMAIMQPIYLQLAAASGMQDAEKRFPTVEQLQGLAPPPTPKTNLLPYGGPSGQPANPQPTSGV